MKRTAICLPLAIILLLTGCGSDEKQRAAELEERVCAAEEISFTAQLRAEYEDKTARFKLACSYSGSQCLVEILEPEAVAGIKARTADGESELLYDGVILDIGSLDARGLCPMSALPLLLEAMKGAYTELAWYEDDMLCMRLVPDDDYTVTLFADGQTLVPKSAEIVYRERVVAFIEISDWSTGG